MNDVMVGAQLSESQMNEALVQLTAQDVDAALEVQSAQRQQPDQAQPVPGQVPPQHEEPQLGEQQQPGDQEQIREHELEVMQVRADNQTNIRVVVDRYIGCKFCFSLFRIF